MLMAMCDLVDIDMKWNLPCWY